MIWQDPEFKPENLPGENHSRDVLLLMKPRGWVSDNRVMMGHVSSGHWRPIGGNGNFDDDVEAWMELPELPVVELRGAG